MSDAGGIPETISTYLRLRGLDPGPRKRRRRKDPTDENQPFTPGRDPRGLGDVLTDLTHQAGWDGWMSEEDLLRAWPEIAGEETARHAMPVGLEHGTLTIQCDSTAWAKQLGLMRAQLLTRILEQHPAAGVTAVRFIGPDVPSWKFGPRAIPGRGPRDTYG
jgi:predicted nucleic acid-binding Zn ribbon protein